MLDMCLFLYRKRVHFVCAGNKPTHIASNMNWFYQTVLVINYRQLFQINQYHALLDSCEKGKMALL